MSSPEIRSEVYHGSATDGVPGTTSCPHCRSTLQSTSVPDPDEVTSILERACPDCDYETEIAVIWFPDQRYLVVSDPVTDVQCERDGCDSDARLISIPSATQMIHRHCLEHVKGHLKTVSADARLL